MTSVLPLLTGLNSLNQKKKIFTFILCLQHSGTGIKKRNNLIIRKKNVCSTGSHWNFRYSCFFMLCNLVFSTRFQVVVVVVGVVAPMISVSLAPPGGAVCSCRRSLCPPLVGACLFLRRAHTHTRTRTVLGRPLNCFCDRFHSVNVHRRGEKKTYW